MERWETKVEVNTTIGSTQVSPQDISITLTPGRQTVCSVKKLCELVTFVQKAIIWLWCVCLSRFRGQHCCGSEAAAALPCGSVLPCWCISIDAGEPGSCKCSWLKLWWLPLLELTTWQISYLSCVFCPFCSGLGSWRRSVLLWPFAWLSTHRTSGSVSAHLLTNPSLLTLTFIPQKSTTPAGKNSLKGEKQHRTGSHHSALLKVLQCY